MAYRKSRLRRESPKDPGEPPQRSGVHIRRTMDICREHLIMRASGGSSTYNGMYVLVSMHGFIDSGGWWLADVGGSGGHRVFGYDV